MKPGEGCWNGSVCLEMARTGDCVDVRGAKCAVERLGRAAEGQIDHTRCRRQRARAGAEREQSCHEERYSKSARDDSAHHARPRPTWGKRARREKCRSEGAAEPDRQADVLGELPEVRECPLAPAHEREHEEVEARLVRRSAR